MVVVPTRGRGVSAGGAATLSSLRPLSITTMLMLLFISSAFVSVMGQDNPSCSVCPDGVALENLDREVQEPISNERISCGQLQSRAELGFYSEIQCKIFIQPSASATCGCAGETLPPTTGTDQPVAPTPAPSAQTTTPATEPPVTAPPPTEPPVTAPPPPLTEVPSPEPIVTEMPVTEPPATEMPGGEMTESPAVNDTMKPVTGRVSIDLSEVSGTMSTEVVALYETATTTFLQAALADQASTTTVSSTQIIQQSFIAASSTSTNSTRRLLRNLNPRKLQESGSLATVVSVSGSQETPNSATFSSLVAQAINDDPEGYIAALQDSGTDYFDAVTDVTSSDGSPGEPSQPPATEAPAAGGRGGLSPGAKAGIAIGVIVGVALIAGGGYWIYKNQDKFGSGQGSGGGSRVLEPPSAPAAGAAAARASARASSTTSGAAGGGKTFIHKVDALPGKLGLSIKVGPEGPAISNIKPESPLSGVLEEGDVIVAIDDIKTKSMSGQEVSALMVKTLDSKRTITVLTKTGPSRYTRKVTAPSGKLGLLIKVSSAGPAINKMKPESPLVGILKEDDFILAIDDVNTKNMSAAEVSELMINTQDKERTLTIVRLAENERKSVGPSAPGAAVPYMAPPARRDDRKKRDVNAPAGKLGLILKAAPDGPLVHQIKEGSPLIGHVFQGDCIISIDEVDTTTMSATEISELMVKTQKHERVITVLSDREPTATSPPKPVSKPSKSKFTREVTAQKGKLGVTIETTSSGPAVHKIKDDSQMNGLLRIGDIIQKIDDVETSSMSASAISALMVKTEDKVRTFTVLSDEP